MLAEEMDGMEGEMFTTEKGNNIMFKFELIPADMKWVSSMCGELNNAALYFSPFANVNQKNKGTIDGSIGGHKATWQPWEYKNRLKTVRKGRSF